MSVVVLPNTLVPPVPKPAVVPNKLMMGCVRLLERTFTHNILVNIHDYKNTTKTFHYVMSNFNHRNMIVLTLASKLTANIV